jgi:hypothetical protein
MKLWPIITANARNEDRIFAASEANFTIVAEAPKDPANKDASAKPRFSLSAYNGGPMRVSGYRFPVIIEARGIRAAAANLPIYAWHSQAYDSPSAQAEQLFGQTDEFTVDQANGQITCAGPITGSSNLCKTVMANAAAGFKFQASINAQPSQMDFLPSDQTTTVNGRTVAGPMFIARAVTCDHVAIVPLGADSSTVARIAAEAAKGHSTMQFEAWLKATHGLEADKISASARAVFEKEFATIQASAGTATAVVQKATEATPATVTATGAIDSAAQITAHRKAMADETRRLAAVGLAAKNHPEIAAKAIDEGWDVDRTKSEVELCDLRAARRADETRTLPTTFNGNDPSISASRATEALMLIAAGYDGERLVKDRNYGEKVVNTADVMRHKVGRGQGPSAIARIVARTAGVILPDGHSDDFWRAVLTNEQICPRHGSSIAAAFSSMNLPVILSNVMNKFVIDGYAAVDPDLAGGGIAWQKWVKRSPVQDFKPHFRVRLVGNLILQKLGRTGEIQHGKIGEQSYTVTADTKAIMLGLSRKDLINDDLNAMSSIPKLFGIAAGETLATDIYTAWLAAKQSDGSTDFFTSSNITTENNQMVANVQTSSALSLTSLVASHTIFGNQTKPNGTPAGIVGSILLAPPALWGTAKQLCQSTELISVFNSGSATTPRGTLNEVANMQQAVISAYLSLLSGGSATTWYHNASPNSPAYPIEVGFLNGQEMPTIEQADADFNLLGINFRTFFDYGVALAEPRGSIKSTA